MLKSSLGSGLLAMPNAFMNAGLLVGVLGTLVLGTICAHCTYILVRFVRDICNFHLFKFNNWINYNNVYEKWIW